MKNGDPGQAATVADLVAGFAARGEATAIHAVADDRRWTFARLADTAGKLAAGLRRAGVDPGERLVLLAPNRPEWIVAALGTMAAGAAVLPLDTLMGRDDLAHAIADSGARRAFTTADRLDALAEAEFPDDGVIWLLDDAGADGVQSWTELLDDEAADLPSIGPDDLATHFYTSGTSGRPKGVPLTHGNLMSNVRGMLAERLVGPDERACLPLPLFHVYPFTVGMLFPLAAGATLVLPAGVSGPEIAQALRDGRATALVGVPRLYEALLAAIRRQAAARGRMTGAGLAGLLAACVAGRRRLGRNLGPALFRPIRQAIAPDLRLLASGGARLEPETAYALECLGWEVLTGYGLTETSPIVTFNGRGRARLETAGQPLAGVELRIAEADETGIGEVQVRGPNVFSGYHSLPEKTAEAFTEDGWFRTGDLGSLEPDSYLRLSGRRSSMIVLGGGKNVDPEEVEEAYAGDPAVREIGVLEDDGDLVALVVPAPGQEAEAVARAIRETSSRLQPYRRISGHALSPQPLPRTPLGKIRRADLVELYRAAKEGRAAPARQELSLEDRRLLQSDAARRVWDYLQERYGDRGLSMDASPQADLGIDSLDWVSLSLDLQQVAGIRLTERTIAGIATVRDLVEAAVTASAAGETAEPEELAPDQKRWVEPPGPALETVARLLSGLDRAAFRWPFPLTVRGRERLPETGPFLIAPNHVSYLDPFAVAAALPEPILRRTWFGGFSGLLFADPVRRAFSRIAHVFPIDALTPGSSIAYGEEVLRRGNVLVWFPEGQRSEDGALQPFMPGTGMLIARSGAPVVPAHLAGTFEAWPRGRRLPRPHPASVAFGEPQKPEALEAAGEGRDRHARIADGLRKAVAALAEA